LLFLHSAFLFFVVHFCFSDFPLLTLGVGTIFSFCMTGSLFHSLECHSVPRRRWPGPQSGILGKSPNATRNQSRLPTLHNITNLCKIQSTTSIFFIESDPTSASTLLLSIRLRFLANRLHQAARSGSLHFESISAISPPNPNSRHIIPSLKRYEISRKPDSEDTMKASDSEAIINLSQ
jgi:hypothetical protein